MNICIFKGWVQEKPEIKYTPNGKKVCVFDIAVPRRFKAQDGKREYDYIRCETWESRAEFCAKWLEKGTEVVVQGSLRLERYEKDGVKKTKMTLRLENIEFCGRGGSQGGVTVNGNISTPPTYTQDTEPSDGFEKVSDDGDLPF